MNLLHHVSSKFAIKISNFHIHIKKFSGMIGHRFKNKESIEL